MPTPNRRTASGFAMFGPVYPATRDEPMARHDMHVPSMIIDRMVEDIAALRRDHPVGPIELTTLGWTLPQVLDHGPVARRRYEAERAKPFCRDDVVPIPGTEEGGGQ